MKARVIRRRKNQLSKKKKVRHVKQKRIKMKGDRKRNKREGEIFLFVEIKDR